MGQVLCIKASYVTVWIMCIVHCDFETWL